MIFKISVHVFKLVKIAMLPKIRQKCPQVSHFGFLCNRLNILKYYLRCFLPYNIMNWGFYAKSNHMWISSGLGYLLFHAVQDLNIFCFRLPRWNMNWPNCLFPILLVFTSILLTSTEAFLFRRLRIRIGTIPTTRPPVVIPTECNEVIDDVCYQYCAGGGCDMECFNSEYYHSCYQFCNGEYLV